MCNQKPCYEIGRFSINCNAHGTHNCRRNTTNAASGPDKPRGAPITASATNAADRPKVASDAAGKPSKWTPAFGQPQENRPRCDAYASIKVSCYLCLFPSLTCSSSSALQFLIFCLPCQYWIGSFARLQHQFVKSHDQCAASNEEENLEK